MDKIVGNWIFFLFLCVGASLYGAPADELTVCSFDGMPLKQAGIGQPFIVKFTTQYEDSKVQEPRIDTVPGLVIQRTGFQMRTVNRVTQVVYTYTVRATKRGTYHIGPIHFVRNGKKMRSNIVTIDVADAEHINTQAVNQKQKNYAFARLMVSKNKAYVGEKISYTIRFYYQDPSTEVEQLVRPALNGFKIAEQNQGYKGKEKVDDVLYYYNEWSWDLYPTHVGEAMLDAHRIDFIQAGEQDEHISRLRMFLGPQVEHKRVYTNEQSVTVIPLPPHEGNVIGIGTFKQFKATINPAVSKEGEAMVLVLSLEGDGNFEELTFPLLDGLPNCFKSYPSKQYVTETAGITEKKFEFILQGMNEGDWEIPAQKCSYFDVASDQYKTLYTTPLHIKILPSASAYSSVDSTVQQKSIRNDEKKTPIVADSAMAIMHHWGAAEVEYSCSFLWMLFWSLVLCVIFISVTFFASLKTKFISLYGVSRKGYIKKARMRLCVARADRNAAAIYPLLVDLIAHICKKKKEMVTEEYIMQLFTADAWHAYVKKAIEYAFFTVPVDNTDFFDETSGWIDQLEEKL